MKKKVIDCVILNYNDAETTLNILKSIESYSIFDHIIVVDNCSTDDSFSRLTPFSNDKIIVISCEKNGGYGAGNNAGVFYSQKHFDSEYVVIANPDVIFEEKCIGALQKEMDADKTCALAAPVQLNAQGGIIQDYAWPFPTKWQAIFSAGHYLRRVMWKSYGDQWLQKKINDGFDSVKVDCLPGAMLMVRTNDFCRFSGYDEDNFLYWEEAMIGKKITDNGCHSLLLVSETYIHNHAVSINKSIPKAINRIKLLLKGRYHFIKYYLKANKIQLGIAKLFFRLCIIEESIITKVKNI